MRLLIPHILIMSSLTSNNSNTPNHTLRKAILTTITIIGTLASIYAVISQNDSPIAEIYTNPPPFIKGNEIKFYGDNSVDVDGTIEKYLWDFGDGTSSSEQNPTHTYNMVGDYRVRLSVWDNNESLNIQSMNISINPQDESDLTITLEPFVIQNTDFDPENMQEIFRYGLYEDDFIQNYPDLFANQEVHFNINYNGINTLKFNVTKVSFNSNPIADFANTCLIEQDPRILDFTAIPVSTKNEPNITMPIKIDYLMEIKTPYNEIPQLENVRDIKVLDDVMYQFAERKPVTVSYVKYEIESTNLDTNEKDTIKGSSPMILPIDPKNWDKLIECGNNYSNN